MEFEQWVAAQGFDVNALTEQQSTSLRALFGERLKAEDRRLKEDGSAVDVEGAGVATENVTNEKPLQSSASSLQSPTPPLDPIDEMRQRWTLERKRIAAIARLYAGKFPELEARAVEEGWDLPGGQTQRDVAIDVAVQKKLGQEQNEALDPLLALAEEIAEHFRGKRLDSFPDAARVKTEFKPIYAPEHIEQLRTFTSVLTLTFRVIGG
uniref:Uncharacterized protein n=1 Tax=Schlesneria paludicola TaxID=360056 RepID=A0A7C4QRK5_9PLAN